MHTALVAGLLLPAAALITQAPPPLPGPVSDYRGFARHDFTVDGCATIVVEPKSVAPGRPWIWRAEFFDHEPQADVALLERGWHLVYITVGNTFGCPDAMKHWDVLYAELTGTYGFSPRPALEGLSRGGLYCYNWAAAHPTQVCCVYGDAPVCDFKSWPGGKGTGPGSAGDWADLLRDYHFADEAEALAYKGNPVDNLAPLAEAGVPLLHVFGDADEAVPWEENTGLVAERYRELGGHIMLICKPGGMHHPHSLVDPAPIVQFIAQSHAR
jgi:pimeloyl-ACP methyl ester carboxylesterase